MDAQVLLEANVVSRQVLLEADELCALRFGVSRTTISRRNSVKVVEILKVVFSRLHFMMETPISPETQGGHD